MPKSTDQVHIMIKILETLNGHDNGIAIRDLAEECGMSKSALHRSLQTLKDGGWVYQDETGTYTIGLKLLVLASQSRLNMTIVKQLEPIMRRLAKTTAQTIILSVLEEDHSVCLHTIESDKKVRLHSQIGSKGPLHAGATGKTLLSFGPPELLDELLLKPLKKYTPFTITNPDKLREETEKIRRLGYSLSAEEVDAGATAVSAPILDIHGNLIAGITIAGTRFDFDENAIEEYTNLVTNAAKSVFGLTARTEAAENEK